MASLTDLGWGYIALLVLFAAIFVAVLVVLIRHPPSVRVTPPPEPATSGHLADAMAVAGAVPDPYLLRFVVDDAGERVGESLSMTRESLIVKREGVFHAVPLASVHIESGELVARGVDWDAAKTAGEAWRKQQAAQHEALELGKEPSS